MAALDRVIEELVTANRILAQEGIVDSFGHASVRHSRASRMMRTMKMATSFLIADLRRSAIPMPS